MSYITCGFLLKSSITSSVDIGVTLFFINSSNKFLMTLSLFDNPLILLLSFVVVLPCFSSFIISIPYFLLFTYPINIYVTCGCCGKKHKCRIDGMNGDCDEEDEEED